MKLAALLMMEVHYSFFALSCALLAGLLWTAKIQADKVSYFSDQVLVIPGNLPGKSMRLVPTVPVSASAPRADVTLSPY